MIIDSSAMIAILTHEPEAVEFLRAISKDPECSMSVANHLEAAMVLSRSEELSSGLDAMLDTLGVKVVPVTLEHGQLAIQAFQAFGKGRHSAKLNFGDCFAYALAKQRKAPLLFKGNDFSQTDIDCAEY